MFLTKNKKITPCNIIYKQKGLKLIRIIRKYLKKVINKIMIKINNKSNYQINKAISNNCIHIKIQPKDQKYQILIVSKI